MSTLDELLRTALDALKEELQTGVESVSSHQVTMVWGIENPAAISAFAAYALIVGIGQGIRADLTIATELLGGGPEFGDELRCQVERIVGASNAVSDDFREDQRNPWFTECLSHALLNLSRHVDDLAPPGRVAALTLVHTDVKDHGLDLVGLHSEDALLGLHIAEAKASEKNASSHGSATARLFQEVDAGSRDPEIRATVQLLREVLVPEEQCLVTPGFWRGRRSYFAIISYGSASSFAPTRPRPTYGRLAVGPERIRLVAVPISDYRVFFDTLAERVRTLVPMVAGAGGTP